MVGYVRPGLRRRRQPAGPGQPADRPAEPTLPANGDQPPGTAQSAEPEDKAGLDREDEAQAVHSDDVTADASAASTETDGGTEAGLTTAEPGDAEPVTAETAAEAGAAESDTVDPGPPGFSAPEASFAETDGAETSTAAETGALDDGTAEISAVGAGTTVISAVEAGTAEPATETADGKQPAAPARRRRSWLGATRLGRHARAAAARVPVTRLRVPVTGLEFSRLTLLPVLLVIAWLLPAIPLLLGGSFALAPMLAISIPLALLLIYGVLRRVPACWPMSAQGRQGLGAPAPLWSLLATAAVAGGFIAWQILMKSQALIVTRDPGVYLQFGYWIAHHGSVGVPTSAAAFGGVHSGLGYASTGFTQHGAHLTPDFMAGLPSVLAAGFWAGGTGAVLLVPPVLGGLAVLTFGGLTGRLAGPRWAPAGALVLALALPEQYTSRTAFAEPLTQILLFGGLCLIIDALSLPSEPAAPATSFLRRWHLPRPPGAMATLAAMGGLAVGLTGVARIDGLSVALPVLLLIGVMLAGRRRGWWPLFLGLMVGAGYAVADGYVLARPYLDSLSGWTGPLGIIAGGAAVIILDVAMVWRYAGLGRFTKRVFAMRPLRWLPWATAGLAVLVAAGFAIRPYVQTVRGDTNPGEVAYVSSLQRLAGLPLDPTRLYSEDTLYWVIWYIGLPALLLGVFGLALLAHKVTRSLLTWSDADGTARLWALPLLIIGWVTVTVLWRPGTVPDQPWAARRLVPVVLPGLILAAVWAAAWLNGRAVVRGAGRLLSSAVAALCVAALLLPTALTTFGIGVANTGTYASDKPKGGLALQPTGLGQAAAVDRLCGSIGSDSSVVIVAPLVASQFAQLIRGMCDVPVAVMSRPSAFAVQPVLTGIAAAHRRPVLLGVSSQQVSRYGYGPAPREVLDLTSTQDAHALTHPPSGTWPARYVIWMSQPSSLSS